MTEIYRPLQVGFNHQVLEQNRKFYFIVSATMGINLETTQELLDVHFLKDVFEGMGENPLPDMGMPKPNGEFLVSGNFFSPENQNVTGSEVKVSLGEIEKKLYIFGPRKWTAGLPSKPEKIKSLTLDYTRAFGGKEFKKNPEGIGFDDGLLPCIEDPKHLVASRNDKPEPAGFSPLSPMLPQRMKYQGTYNSDYKQKYFPGYPEDHDWKFYLCAPQDQWKKGYYNGDESFSLCNLHPEIPLIEGNLPGLYARCFLNQEKKENAFGELPLNLDTIWFFPEQLLGLMIFRGITEVEDDEAGNITHILCAYEDKSQRPRSMDYYLKAFEKRITNNDDLLKNLNTQDLIPTGHKSTMELLMEMGEANVKGTESPMSNNFDAKAKSMQKMGDEKIEEAIQQAEKYSENTGIPETHKTDIRKMMDNPPDTDPDLDIEEMNQKLEAILPGITTEGLTKEGMKNFSFKKVDEIADVIENFSIKKQNSAKELHNQSLENTREQVKKQINQIDEQIEKAKKETGAKNADQISMLEKSKQKMSESLENFDDIDFDTASTPQKTPLPRIDEEQIKMQMSFADPKVMDAMQHLQSMKIMGIEAEKTEDLEKQIQNSMNNTSEKIIRELQRAKNEFKSGYLVTAHFMDEGLPPHKESLEEVKKCFIHSVSKGEDISGKDWACIDLSGINLDGIDLSGAYLEQVNFRGASLKGTNFSKAILARADFEDADLTGANLENANVGAVNALRADFTEANLKSAKLSKGNFTKANFTSANLEDIESLEIIIDDTNFTKANMPKICLIEINMSGVKFVNADLNSSAFVKCRMENCDFSGSVINRCAFVETWLQAICFTSADLSNSCFVTSDTEKSAMKELKFDHASLVQANFQNMKMKNTNLTHADLENAFFGGTDLSESDLSHARAKSTQFRKAILTGAKLDNINLDGGSLAKADLVGASFKGANLHAVDFLRSTITDTNFRGSNLDSTLIEHWRPE